MTFNMNFDYNFGNNNNSQRMNNQNREKISRIFPDGTWVVAYGMNYSKKYKFNLKFSRNGPVQGTGRDSGGDFTMKGRWSASSYRINLTKKYRGVDDFMGPKAVISVQYNSKNAAFYGTWEIYKCEIPEFGSNGKCKLYSLDDNKNNEKENKKENKKEKKISDIFSDGTWIIAYGTNYSNKYSCTLQFNKNGVKGYGKDRSGQFRLSGAWGGKHTGLNLLKTRPNSMDFNPKKVNFITKYNKDKDAFYGSFKVTDSYDMEQLRGKCMFYKKRDTSNNNNNSNEKENKKNNSNEQKGSNIFSDGTWVIASGMNYSSKSRFKLKFRRNGIIDGQGKDSEGFFSMNGQWSGRNYSIKLWKKYPEHFMQLTVNIQVQYNKSKDSFYGNWQSFNFGTPIVVGEGKCMLYKQ